MTTMTTTIATRTMTNMRMIIIVRIQYDAVIHIYIHLSYEWFIPLFSFLLLNVVHTLMLTASYVSNKDTFNHQPTPIESDVFSFNSPFPEINTCHVPDFSIQQLQVHQPFSSSCNNLVNASARSGEPMPNIRSPPGRRSPNNSTWRSKSSKNGRKQISKNGIYH